MIAAVKLALAVSLVGALAMSDAVQDNAFGGSQITVPVLLGAVAPGVIAVLNRLHWTTERKQLVAIAVSVALAVVALLLTGGFSDPWPDVPATLLLVIGTAQAAYALVWKPTGAAPAIEANVNLPALSGNGKHAEPDQ